MDFYSVVDLFDVAVSFGGATLVLLRRPVGGDVNETGVLMMIVGNGVELVIDVMRHRTVDAAVGVAALTWLIYVWLNRTGGGGTLRRKLRSLKTRLSARRVLPQGT